APSSPGAAEARLPSSAASRPRTPLRLRQPRRLRAGESCSLSPRCQLLDDGGERRIGAPTADGDAAAQEPAANHLALEEPDPPSLIAVCRSRTLRKVQGVYLDQCEVVTAGAQVEESAVHAPVQQRCERNDERLRRQDATRDEAWVAPAVE